MRILANIHALSSSGGIEQIVFQTSKELARRGHELDLLYVQDGDLSEDYRSFCQSLTRVPTFNFARSNAARDLARLVPAVRAGRRCRPDVIYISRFQEVTYGILTGWTSRAPVVCHLHYLTQHGPTRLMGRQVRRFIAVSEATRREWIHAGLDPAWIEVIPNGIDPSKFTFGGAEERRRARQTLGLPLDAFIALYCGRMSPEKGVEVLIDAWKQIGFDRREGRLLLVGMPPEPSRIDVVAEYQRRLIDSASETCEWLPARRDVVPVMHAADVVVVPSHYETFGLTALEAMATGRPVIASKAGGLPEILDGSFEPFLFEDGDSTALADHLRSLIGWQGTQPDLALACRGHVEARFTLNSMVDAIQRVLLDASLR